MQSTSARNPRPAISLPIAISLALLAVAGAAPWIPAPAAAAVVAGKPQTGLKVVPLSISTADGRTHRYQIEVAATGAQQAHGMMFRTAMAPNSGMIFPMHPPRTASFWMENTLIPLDLLFIGADGRIRNIIAEATPKSQAMLNSLGPVAAVLELKGGEAARIGAKPGDRVVWGPQ